jgi:cyclic pyranopterin phosphate synthase
MGSVDPLLDTLGRPLETLRISVTDRCNFRCVYCMPKEVYGRDHQFLERKELLSLEEIARVAGVFAELGVRRVRITGGEPLVRRNVEYLVELLHAIPGLELALTTNGALLPQKAQALADAGLDRVTVSLDSVDDATFRALNDVDFPVTKVLEGIDAAAAAGLRVKVNAVVKRGANDDGLVALAEQFRGTGHVLRFIEYMDVGHTNGWRLDDVVSSDEIVAMIDAVHPLEPVAAARPDETARRYRYRDGAGEIGVIACDQAVLRRLLACPPLGRGPPPHLPLRAEGPRPARPAPARRLGRRARRADPRQLDPQDRPLLRAPHLEDGRLAEDRDVLHRRLSRPPGSRRPRPDGHVGSDIPWGHSPWAGEPRSDGPPLIRDPAPGAGSGLWTRFHEVGTKP